VRPGAVNLLLDTCTALWIALEAPELSARARQLFEDPGNRIYLSTVSTWEISLKHSLGRLPFPEAPDVLVPEIRRRGLMTSLPFGEEATLQLFRLPAIHRDPFDRMLICRAIVGGMTIVTSDAQIRRYPVLTAW